MLRYLLQFAAVALIASYPLTKLVQIFEFSGTISTLLFCIALASVIGPAVYFAMSYAFLTVVLVPVPVKAKKEETVEELGNKH